MATFQNLLDQARLTLQDADKTRYPDIDLLVYANEAMRVLKKYRSDLSFLTLTTPLVDYIVGDNFPFAAEFDYLVKLYIIGAANMRDDEYAVDGKASRFLKNFIEQVKAA